MPRKVLVLGATSAIAQETCRLLAQDGDRLFLVGRDADKLDALGAVGKPIHRVHTAGSVGGSTAISASTLIESGKRVAQAEFRDRIDRLAQIIISTNLQPKHFIYLF